MLASHPNRVFSADEIFERVWQQESVVSAKNSYGSRFSLA